MCDNKRIYAIDNIKGIMMFLVVFGHFLLSAASKGEGLSFDIYTLIYSFHMPVFMFISGYLTHDTSIEWFKKYLLIYIIFNSIYFVVGTVYCGANLSPINPAYSMWYILLLLMFRFVMKLVKGINGFILILVSLVLYIILPLCNIGDFFVHIKFAAFFIYFVFGYLSQKCFTIRFYDVRKKSDMLISAIICVVSILLMYQMNLTWDLGFSFVNHATPYATFGMVVISLISLFLNIICIYSMMYAMPNVKLFSITTLGVNSLYVFLLHRIFTMIVPVVVSDNEWILISLLFSILTCLVFGSKLFVEYISTLLSLFDKYLKSLIAVIMLCVMFLCAASSYSTTEAKLSTNYPEITKSSLDDCIKISYVGDMLLFEEDIVRAERNANDFSKLFEYTKPYFGDYTFGVFEGVVSNEYYSDGNYYDGKNLHLKYPYEFAKSVSENIDFVTLGMNHLMDGGIECVDNTVSTFESLGLDYTGAYLSKEDNDSVKIVDLYGIKAAILSYTDILNYPDDIYPYTCNFFEYDEIIKDIECAKDANVDLIIAMTHIGTQFNHSVNDRQKYWNNVFASNGVDIILSDHAHVVEPIEYKGDTVIINCPGNYYTSLSGEDQEYGAICNLYVDKNTKKVVTTSIVPIKSVVTPDCGMVVPLYDINDINGTNLVLDNMIGIKVSNLLPEYFYSKNGYNMYNDDTVLYDFFENKKVCFIGDSITAGTVNNGHGWYEYIADNYVDVSIGGATSESILDLLRDGVPEADVYVCAIGCNDIRYHQISADEYLSNIESIVDLISNDVNSELYFVSPWYTLHSDSVSKIDYATRNKMIESYNNVLETYCSENGYHYVDTYTDLKSFFENCDNYRQYILDGVHPNSCDGIMLYGDIFVQNAK